MFDGRKKKTDSCIAKKRFVTLHEIPEIDSMLEVSKKYFQKKYNIDYLSIHMIHSKKTTLLGRYDQDNWHEYLYNTNQGTNHPSLHYICSIIGKDELYLQYFDTVMKDRDINVRAEMIGVRKYGGCGLIISDQLKNITIYDITIKDDAAFGTLEKKVLYDLIQDLVRYKSLLLPFINHADQFGDFSDKNVLHQSIDSFKKDNPSLFFF